MLSLSGTHGTSATRAFKIKSSGFKTNHGLMGFGVYFWCDSPYSDKLAEAWWNFYFSNSRYEGDDNKNCAVLYVEINVEEVVFLDLEQRDIKLKLASTALKRNIRFDDKRASTTLIVQFIRRLERKLNIKYKVIEKSVPTPPKEYCRFYPISIIGSPHCYLVTDKGCIQINKIEIYRD